MITRTELIQLKAFARIDGAVLGVIMLATFLAFVASLTSPMLQLVYMAGIVLVPVYVAMRVRNYRDRIVEKRVSLRRAAAYSMFCFGYASLILALGVFVYLSYFDNGNLMMSLKSYFDSPEMQEALKVYGTSAAGLKEQIDALGTLRPVDVAFSLISNTLLSGMVCSLIIAALSRREPRFVK